MTITKKIDFGEYVLIANYDNENGLLEVTVLDELGDVIESIEITNDQDENEY
jgi:hypothetical protein